MVVNIFSKAFFVTLFFASLALFSSAQIDSASVQLSFTTGPDPMDANSTIDFMNVDVTVYSVSSVGEVVISVNDVGMGFPIEIVAKTAQELSSEGLVTGNTIHLKVPRMSPLEDYRIETALRNIQGANFPLITTDYNYQ